MRIGSTTSDAEILSRAEEVSIDALSNIAEVIGIDDMIDESITNRPFSATMEHALGVWAREKTYTPDDPYIDGHGLRRSITQNARKTFPNRHLAWKESLGILDIGGGTAGAIPLAAMDGGYIALFYGFFCSAMLRYRRLELETDGVSPKFEIPTSTQRALKMPAGAEVEFVGQGRLNLGTGIAIGTGIAFGPFWAGVAGLAPLTNEGIKEYSVTVTAVDGRGRMRFVIRQLDSLQTTAGVLGTAGFISPGYSGPALNADGSRILLVGNESTVRATGMFADLSSASIGLSASHLAKSTVISAFEIDLNSEHGQSAYQDLLRLCPSTAYNLAEENDPSVQLLTVKEKQTEFATSGYVSIFGDKIFSTERLLTERNGEMLRRDGSKLIYRNTIFERKSTNFFKGKKHVCWESISLNDSNKSKQEMFFHLNFERLDYEFVASKLTHFENIGKALHIPTSNIKYSEGQTPQSFKLLTTKAAKVNTVFDIFFTKDGVDEIVRCDQEHASSQYIKAMMSLKTKYSYFPCDEFGIIDPDAKKILYEFIELTSPHHAFGLGKFREKIKLRHDYYELTKRDLGKDVHLLSNALEFGEEIASYCQASSKRSAENLFTRLGQMKGFRFAAAIIALTQIAGRDNCVIKEMNISSRGARIGYSEEAFFKFPRQIVHEELTAE